MASDDNVLVDEGGRKVWIEFTDGGDLEFSAQDIGPDVEMLTGDSDYEFWYTVPKQHLPEFAALAGVNEADIVNDLLAKWQGDRRFSQLQDLMRRTAYVTFSSY